MTNAWCVARVTEERIVKRRRLGGRQRDLSPAIAGLRSCDLNGTCQCAIGVQRTVHDDPAACGVTGRGGTVDEDNCARINIEG
jgi:hypothetical protein